MGELVFIDVAQRQRAVTVQEAWDAWLVAQAKAQQSGRIEDGIAAGKAWRTWLELFAPKGAA